MKHAVSIRASRAAAPGRAGQGQTTGHNGASSWPREGRSTCPANGVQA